MKFKMVHNNINVLDLDKSISFYKEALMLSESRRIEAEDGSFILVYMENEESKHQIELTWLKDRKEPYNLGENEFHIAFETDDFEEALKKHKEMNIVVFENKDMGVYFISDPDGYWIEIL